jgi:hypothetical protein
MKKSRLVYVTWACMVTLICTPVSAVTLGPELLVDPYFDDPLSWDAGIGSSVVENGHLVVINHSGFIFPDPQIGTEVGTTYQYALSVDFVNNLSGGGKVTIGGQTIWEPSSDTGMFTGMIVATDTAGLVFNFSTPYVGRAEFDSVSVKAILATPIPATLYLFGSGLLGLVGMARHKKAA